MINCCTNSYSSLQYINHIERYMLLQHLSKIPIQIYLVLVNLFMKYYCSQNITVIIDK